MGHSDTRNLDLLRLTGVQLQTLLERREFTSLDLVAQILQQIDRHNEKGLELRAMISMAPRQLLLDRAAMLDKEREDGKLRGPLHGLPIIVKDCINTGPETGLGTTLGSLAFLRAQSKSARIIERLLDKGMVVIGKTNLNELCSWKGSGFSNGWSAVGGQTASAYVAGGIDPSEGWAGHSNPCGSSTGSAVGVAAGFSPVALGTETDGSLVQPAARAALYALKPTPGPTTDTDGVYVVSDIFDAVGAMAKCTADLAMLTELVITDEARRNLPADGYLSFLKCGFGGLAIGFLDPDVWRFPQEVQRQHNGTFEQMRSTYLQAIDTISANGARTIKFVDIPLPHSVHQDGEMLTERTIYHSFHRTFERYTNTLTNTPVHTLQDLVDFNNAHAAQELPADHPSQSRLLASLASPSTPTKEQYDSYLTLLTAFSTELSSILSTHSLDLLVAPTDSLIASIASCACWPIGTVPLGVLEYNGRPFGMAVLGREGSEDVLLRFMGSWEGLGRGRQVPAKLGLWKAEGKSDGEGEGEGEKDVEPGAAGRTSGSFVSALKRV